MSSTPDDFDIIHNEVCSIHETWNLVLDLFKEDCEIEVLDLSGSTAWSLIGNALLDSVLLRLTRLIVDTDHGPDKTTMRLQRIMSTVSDRDLKRAMKAKLKALGQKVEVFKDHRHKRVAHWNHEVARGEKELPRICLNDFETILEELSDFMNTFYQSREDARFAYKFTRRVGGGMEILECLRDGLRLRDLRDAAWGGSRTSDQLANELRQYPVAR